MSVWHKVSVSSMWQRFHGCEIDFIRDVCHGRCCDAPSRPGGTLVTIHRSERAAVEARGGVVDEAGFLATDGVCTFKTGAHLCGLHETPDKPFGCIASPFTLTSADTLVVRNRYRMLPCYIPKKNPDWHTYRPAFEAFRASLDLIYGYQEAERLVDLLEDGGDPSEGKTPPSFYLAEMPDESYAILTENDAAKKNLQESSP